MLQTPATLPRSPRAEVIRRVREWVEAGALARGERLPSERALAAELHVARTTVRQALEELQSSGVIMKADRRARRIAGPPTASRVLAGTVFILGDDVDPCDDPESVPGTDTVIHIWLSRLIRQRGLMSLMAGHRPEDYAHGRAIVAEKPRAVILTYLAAETAEGQDILRHCVEAGIPVSAHGLSSQLANLPHVQSDQMDGAYQLTRWLIAQGRKRILPFWRFADRHHWLVQREQGYRKAMLEAGLEPLQPVQTPDFPTSDLREGRLDPATFHQVVTYFAGYLAPYITGPACPDALMLATDHHCMQAAAALRLLNKQPNRDVMLVGYDNTWRNAPELQWENTPPAATIDRSAREIAQHMVAQALEEYAQGRSPSVISVAPRLITP